MVSYDYYRRDVTYVDTGSFNANLRGHLSLVLRDDNNYGIYMTGITAGWDGINETGAVFEVCRTVRCNTDSGDGALVSHSERP